MKSAESEGLVLSCGGSGSWLEISRSCLTRNLRALESAAGDATQVLAVIKADAYGHSAAVCAPVLARAGARWLGVTCAREGVAVREALALAHAAGPPPDILLMCGFLPDAVPAIQQYGLTPVLWTREQIGWLAEKADPTALKPVHVEVDTGMGRQGVPSASAAELEALLVELRAAGLELGGLMTHFASSEVAGSSLTQLQQRRFEQAVAQCAAQGFRPQWVHAGNSSSLDNPAQPSPWLRRLAESVGARAMVRSGMALFGYCLPIEGGAQAQVRPLLEPVLTWKAAVLSLRSLEPGDTVGYNAQFAAREPLRVALLPVGYADGLRRELSSSNLVGGERAGGWVMLRGQRAPILGRISMNLTVVDVTKISGVEAGDEAVVLGRGVSAEQLASLAGTIAYEILCGLKVASVQIVP